MKLLVPGGSRKQNRRKAVQFVVDNIMPASSFDAESGAVISEAGDTFMVSAYAESSAAFVSTPGKDKTEHSIYASGHKVLLVRQLKNDSRIFVYQVDPTAIPPPKNSNTVQWPEIQRVAEKVWVCRDGVVQLHTR
jgi:hypothetical protein